MALARLPSSHCRFLVSRQDYDDVYTIYYAKLNEGFIVSNDAYRDHVEAAKDSKDENEVELR